MHFFSTKIFLSILILFSFASTACTKKDRTTYFPLVDKIRWQYLSTMEYTRRSVKTKLILESLGAKKIDGEWFYIKQNHSGKKTYFFQTNNAILRNPDKASRDDINKTNETNFVIPVNFREGDSWQLQSRPYVLEHAIEYEVALQTSTPGIKLSRPLLLDYKLESLTEHIEVPAGKFYNCAKITGTGSCKMSALGGNFSGSIDVNVKHTDWYCPGVGLTKTIRSEIDPSSLIEPVTYRLELERFVKL